MYLLKNSKKNQEQFYRNRKKKVSQGKTPK